MEPGRVGAVAALLCAMLVSPVSAEDRRADGGNDASSPKAANVTRVLVLDAVGDAGAAERDARTSEVVRLLRERGYHVARAQPACGASDEACLIKHCKRTKLDAYVLLSVWKTRAGRGEPGYYLSMRDVRHRAPLGSVFVERHCATCSKVADELVQEALRQWPHRAGTLVGFVGPEGATVFQGDVALGQLPLQARFGSGKHEVRVQQGDQFARLVFEVSGEERQTIDVGEYLGTGDPSAENVTRRQAKYNDAVAASARAKRRRRWVIGGVLTGAGAVLVGVAAAGYAKKEPCVTNGGFCVSSTSVKTGNHALMAIGAAALAGGVGTMVSAATLRDDRGAPRGAIVSVTGSF